MKQLYKLVYVIILATILAACGTSSNIPPTISPLEVNNTAQSAAATFIAQTAVSTATKLLPPTLLFTPTSAFTSTPTPTDTRVVPSVPNGLRMAYVNDQNLYLQDGNKSPIQLTQGDRDLSPAFSDDGEKIVFLRKFLPHNLFSINFDGSQEQLLVSGATLSSLGAGYDEQSEIISFAFVPKTRTVLFNTRELSQEDIQNQDWQRGTSKKNNDLLMVDTDTGTITVLLTPGRGEDFLISPDGKLIAIQAKGHIDLVGMAGQILYRNLVTYTPTHPYELTPGVFWTNDSTELIVTLPVGTEYNFDGPETRSVWRYPIDGSKRVQVSLNPPPIGSDYNISPDGNWILYSYFYYPGKTSETITAGLYLGNLREGTTQLYSSDVTMPVWNTDSLHFIYEKGGIQGLFAGTVGKQPIAVDDKGRILDWMDVHHYLYYYANNGMIMLGDINGKTTEISNNIPAISLRNGSSTFSFIFLGDK